MAEAVLDIRGIDVAAGDHVVLQDVHLTVGEGEAHILFGPNGSGKSSLLASIMGLPSYRVTRGGILLRGQRIDGLPIDMRARPGLGRAFQ